MVFILCFQVRSPSLWLPFGQCPSTFIDHLPLCGSCKDHTKQGSLLKGIDNKTINGGTYNECPKMRRDA